MANTELEELAEKLFLSHGDRMTPAEAFSNAGLFLMKRDQLRKEVAAIVEPAKDQTIVQVKDQAVTPGTAVTNSVGMRLAYIPAGSFIMGSQPMEKGRVHADEMEHMVRLTRPFLMGVTPVTRREWKQVIGSDLNVDNDADLPMTNISWVEAVEFCKALSGMGGQLYRLPTEAEWEYACRAGTTTAFNVGNRLSPADANYGVEKPLLMPVGKFKPNRWGLHDMHGNVSEWCGDAYSRTLRWGINDPFVRGDDEHPNRVVRGGCYVSRDVCCRSAFVELGDACQCYPTIGFRVVMEIPPGMKVI